MSVLDSINRISGAVDEAKAALTAKGVDVPETATVDDLAPLIAEMDTVDDKISAHNEDTEAHPDIREAKLDKANPTGTGSFSLNRKAGTTIGDSSVAMGINNEASGQGAYSEGYNSVASGIASHAEGYQAKATSAYSHAEGNKSAANAWCTHAEGNNTIANSKSQHVEGEWNVEDPTPNETARGTYAHIVGNGTKSGRSNAHTLDWAGNAWYAGDVYVGGTEQSEGKKLAVEPTDSEILEALTDCEFVEPVADENGAVLTDEAGNIYIL